MAFTAGDRSVRPLSADEVMRMVELGILSEDEPVELLHGVLTEVSAKSPAHEVIVLRLDRWLAAGFAAGRYDVRIGSPLVVPDRTSLPEPDLAVVEATGDPRRHPSTALLVVEVAITSLRTDITVKPALYAAASIPELWVVDVGAMRIRVFTDPHRGGYASETLLGAGGVAQPGSVAVDALDISALFAGLEA